MLTYQNILSNMLGEYQHMKALFQNNYYHNAIYYKLLSATILRLTHLQEHLSNISAVDKTY